MFLERNFTQKCRETELTIYYLAEEKCFVSHKTKHELNSFQVIFFIFLRGGGGGGGCILNLKSEISALLLYLYKKINLF